MKIVELMEGIRLEDFIERDTNGVKINYDLVEDLIYFMNNDDDTYRRFVYPVISKCIKLTKSGDSFEPGIFKPVIVSSYEKYVDKFPIRELPSKLDDKICHETCVKMHEKITKNISNGRYRD